MQKKNATLILLLLWSVQDLASSNAWKHRLNLKPEWCFSGQDVLTSPPFRQISSCSQELRQHWKPAGGFCTSLTLELLGGKAPGLSQKMMGHGEGSAAHPEIFIKTEQSQSSLCGSPAHCWFVFLQCLCAKSQFVMPDLQLLWWCHLQSKLCSIPGRIQQRDESG